MKTLFSTVVPLVLLSSCGFNPSANKVGSESSTANFCSGTSYAFNGVSCFQTIQYTAANGECLWRLGGAVSASMCNSPQPGTGTGGGHNGGRYSCAGYEYRFEFGSCNRYESRYSPTYDRCYFELSARVDDVNCGRPNPPPATPFPRPTSQPSPQPTPTPNPNYTPIPPPDVVEILATQQAVFQLESGVVDSTQRCDVAKGTRLKAKVFYGSGEFSRVKLFSDIPNCSIGVAGTSGYLTRAHLQIR